MFKCIRVIVFVEYICNLAFWYWMVIGLLMLVIIAEYYIYFVRVNKDHVFHHYRVFEFGSVTNGGSAVPL